MKQPAKTILIRPWTQADIDYVTESVERERWGYTKRDIERCWRLEPNGCFIAEVQREKVGHVFSIGFDKTGWIGLLIVNPEYRGKGIGTILTKNAVNYLQKTGKVTIRLEAAEKAIPLYRRLGFKEEFISLRLSKQLEQNEKGKGKRNNGINIFPILEGDIENLAQFDSKYFGANRTRVLQSLYRDQPQHCFMAIGRQKTLGYVMSRKISNGHWIGPLVCENPKAAEKLLHTCMEAIPKRKTELRLGMPILNKNGIKLMKKVGFQQKSKSIRMVWGKHIHEGNVAGIYGIAGPEKG